MLYIALIMLSLTGFHSSSLSTYSTISMPLLCWSPQSKCLHFHMMILHICQSGKSETAPFSTTLITVHKSRHISEGSCKSCFILKNSLLSNGHYFRMVLLLPILRLILVINHQSMCGVGYCSLYCYSCCF